VKKGTTNSFVNMYILKGKEIILRLSLEHENTEA
jgi:hypothetical protein